MYLPTLERLLMALWSIQSTYVAAAAAKGNGVKEEQVITGRPLIIAKLNPFFVSSFASKLSQAGNFTQKSSPKLAYFLGQSKI